MDTSFFDKKTIIVALVAAAVGASGTALCFHMKKGKGGWDRKDGQRMERQMPGAMEGKTGESMNKPLEGGAMQAQDAQPKVQLATIDLKAAEGAGPVEDGSYTVLAGESRMNWQGRKSLLPGGYKDDGIISISEGSLIVADGKATTGSVVVDMTSLRAASTGKGSGEGSLERHIKGKDFFMVETYPTARFALKTATPAADVATSHAYTITGDLTIKDKTNEISMQAVAYTKDGLLHVVATTEIDRTKWGIIYGSGSFFKEMADKAIDDTFTVSFDLVAKKQ
jgi:polyisoprenoid-binding protein YceI